MPAFPFVAGDQTNLDDRAQCEGLTKREYFATMAMQGCLVNEKSYSSMECLVEWSIKYADELLKQLDDYDTPQISDAM